MPYKRLYFLGSLAAKHGHVTKLWQMKCKSKCRVGLLKWPCKGVDSMGRDTLCLSLVPISLDVDIMVGALATILYQEVILQLQGTRTRRELKYRESLRI